MTGAASVTGPGNPVGSGGHVPGGMRVATTRAELAAARAGLAGTVAVVMTMGALHDGHEALIAAARGAADQVLVTIFVNPLQFGPTEDFDRYPRTLEVDLGTCARAGVDVVFAPDRDQMYPDGEPAVRISPGPVGEILEGTSRPGFFHGVLTVVNKLLHLTRADVTVFGEKDYQQLTLVRRLVRDTDLPVRVLAVPTVREADGLARSSRNRYLSPGDRGNALAMSAALRAGADLAAGGAGPDATLAGARAQFERTGPGAKLDYLVLTDPDLGPAPLLGPARLLVAGYVGGTRLIDNGAVELCPPQPVGVL